MRSDVGSAFREFTLATHYTRAQAKGPPVSARLLEQHHPLGFPDPSRRRLHEVDARQSRHS